MPPLSDTWGVATLCSHRLRAYTLSSANWWAHQTKSRESQRVQRAPGQTRGRSAEQRAREPRRQLLRALAASASAIRSGARARASGQPRVVCRRASEDAAHGVADEKDRGRLRGAASVLPLQRRQHGDQEAALPVQQRAVKGGQLLVEVESEPVQQGAWPSSLCGGGGERAGLARLRKSQRCVS